MLPWPCSFRKDEIGDGVHDVIRRSERLFFLFGLWFVTRLRLTRQRYEEVSGRLAERPAGISRVPPSLRAHQ